MSTSQNTTSCPTAVSKAILEHRPQAIQKTPGNGMKRSVEQDILEVAIPLRTPIKILTIQEAIAAIAKQQQQQQQQQVEPESFISPIAQEAPMEQLPPATLYRFSDLPKKVQQMIWKAAIPRFYMYRFMPVMRDDGIVYYEPSLETKKATQMTRSLLGSCRMARENVLQCLPNAVRLASSPWDDISPHSDRILHFNAFRDIFNIVNLGVEQLEWLQTTCSHSLFTQVRNLGLEVETDGCGAVYAGYKLDDYMADFLMYFPGLRRLYLVDPVLSEERDNRHDRLMWTMNARDYAKRYPDSMVYKKWFAWTEWAQWAEDIDRFGLEKVQLDKRPVDMDDCRLYLEERFDMRGQEEDASSGKSYEKWARSIDIRVVRRMKEPDYRFPLCPAEGKAFRD
ncbi:hypothetical protein NKR23_g4293 [Pleurostoma richardsiae]|uniref:2EXR domain-containing protein n=1 Tax=Pleurostoma richardsiae TaxID=41990 RepID=A0AA38RJH5_9PEZI|nr:hypothetical protein NKR23_g4293 [Pleurostoma richardsiae]